MQWFFLLRKEIGPVFGFGLGEVDGDEAGVRGIFVGDEKPDGAIIADDIVAGVEGGEELDDGGVGSGFEVAVKESVLGAGTGPDMQDEVAVVLGEAGTETPLGLVRAFIDELVFVLRIAEAMQIELLVEVGVLEFLAGSGRRIAAVVEAAAVGQPGGSGEFDPLDFIRETFAGGDVDDIPGGPVGAGLGEGVGKELAVLGDGGAGDGDGAIGREGVGIEQEDFLGIGFVLAPVVDALVLQARFAGVKEAAGDEGGQTVLVVVPGFGEAFFEGLALGDFGEKGFGESLLRFDPGSGLGGVEVFEPAVGVGDGLAVEGFGDVSAAGFGVGEGCGLFCGGGHDQGKHGKRQEEIGFAHGRITHRSVGSCNAMH